MTDALAQLAQLQIDRPKLHAWTDAPPIEPEVLAFILEQTSPEMNTLETGCGHSTVTFAIRGTRHCCVVIDRDETKRIQAYCREKHINTRRLRFLLGTSDLVLPRWGLAQRAWRKLDFVFIDGGHRFPVPVLDWYYTQWRLKVGGVVGIDDIDLPSVKILVDFLRGEPDWHVEAELGKTIFFRKVSEPDTTGDWEGQALNRVYRDAVIGSVAPPAGG